MADCPQAHDAVPGLKVTPGIPRERSHAVAQLDPFAIKHLRNLEGAGVDLCVIRAMDGPLDRSRNDFLRAMNLCGMFDDPLAEQRPILHQTKHSNVPPGCFSGLVIVLSAGQESCHEFYRAELLPQTALLRFYRCQLHFGCCHAGRVPGAGRSSTGYRRAIAPRRAAGPRRSSHQTSTVAAPGYEEHSYGEEAIGRQTGSAGGAR